MTFGQGVALPRRAAGTTSTRRIDPRSSVDAKLIIETCSERWPLEVTFHEAKGKLGFEDPQNRTEHAVERAAPMALWLYSLVVIWYVRTGQHFRGGSSTRNHASKSAEVETGHEPARSSGTEVGRRQLPRRGNCRRSRCPLAD
jgi:hypothetical protein